MTVVDGELDEDAAGAGAPSSAREPRVARLRALPTGATAGGGRTGGSSAPPASPVLSCEESSAGRANAGWAVRARSVGPSVAAGAVFVTEAGALGALSFGLVRRWPGQSDLHRGLVIGVTMIALALAVMTAVALVHAAVQATSRTRRADAVQRWLTVWTDVALRRAPPPPGRVPIEAVDALLLLQATPGPVPSERLIELGRAHAIADLALEDVIASGWRRRMSFRRRSSISMVALERMANLGVPRAAPLLWPLVLHGRPSIRPMAIRALARSVGATANPAERALAAQVLVYGLRPKPLSLGLWEETLFLLGDGAGAAVGAILREPEAGATRRIAALHTAGRLRLLELTDSVAAQLDVEDPDVRAAALRCLVAMQHLPCPMHPHVLCALEDPHEGVRVQGTHAARLLPVDLACTRLLVQLADRSWAVRRAAASSLLALGSAGCRLLEQVASSRWDDFGRDMAVQALSDAPPPSPGALTMAGNA